MNQQLAIYSLMVELKKNIVLYLNIYKLLYIDEYYDICSELLNKTISNKHYTTLNNFKIVHEINIIKLYFLYKGHKNTKFVLDIDNYEYIYNQIIDIDLDNIKTIFVESNKFFENGKLIDLPKTGYMYMYTNGENYLEIFINSLRIFKQKIIQWYTKYIFYDDK